MARRKNSNSGVYSKKDYINRQENKGVYSRDDYIQRREAGQFQYIDPEKVQAVRESAEAIRLEDMRRKQQQAMTKAWQDAYAHAAYDPNGNAQAMVYAEKMKYDRLGPKAYLEEKKKEERKQKQYEVFQQPIDELKAEKQLRRYQNQMEKEQADWERYLQAQYNGSFDSLRDMKKETGGNGTGMPLTIAEYKTWDAKRKADKENGALDKGTNPWDVSEGGLEDWISRNRKAAEEYSKTPGQLWGNAKEYYDTVRRKPEGYNEDSRDEYDRALYDSINGENAYAQRVEAIQTDEEAEALERELDELWARYERRELPRYIRGINDSELYDSINGEGAYNKRLEAIKGYGVPKKVNEDTEALNRDMDDLWGQYERGELNEILDKQAEERRAISTDAGDRYFDFGTDYNNWASMKPAERRQALWLDMMGTDYAEAQASMTDAEKAEMDRLMDLVLDKAMQGNTKDFNGAANAYSQLVKQGEEVQKYRENIAQYGTQAEDLAAQGYTGESIPAMLEENKPKYVMDPEDTEGMLRLDRAWSDTEKAVYTMNHPHQLGGTESLYSEANKYMFADEEQVKKANIFYEYDQKNGTHLTEAYLEGIDSYLTSQLASYQELYARALADQPVQGTAARIASYPGKIVTGAAGAIGTVAALLGDENAKDTTSSYYKYDKLINLMRDQQNENIDKALGGNGTGKFLLNVVDSVADNLMAMAVGNKLAGVSAATRTEQNVKRSMRFVQLIMSAEATSGTMIEKLNSGMGGAEAAVYAVGDGIIEWLTERYSLEQIMGPDVKQLLGKGKDLASFLIRSSVAEGSEEIASDLLNIGLDSVVSWINGHENEIRQRVNEYITNGMTAREAEKRVLQEKLGEIASSGLAGALSGFGMAGGRVIANKFSQVQAGRNARNEAGGLQKIIDLAKGMEEGTESRALAEQLDGKKKISNGDLGRLAQTIAMESGEERGNIIRETVYRNVAEELKAANVENAREAAEVITRNLMDGKEKLNKADKAVLAKSEGAIKVWQDFNSGVSLSTAKTQLDIAANTQKVNSVMEQVSDITSQTRTATGKLATDIMRSVKATKTAAEAIDDFRQRRGWLMSESYAQLAKDLLESDKSTQKSKNYLDDVMKIRLAGMSLAKEMPQTGLENAAATALFNAAREEFVEADKERRKNQAKVIPGQGIATIEGAQYGTDAWDEKLNELKVTGDQRQQLKAMAEVAVRLGNRLDVFNDPKKTDVYGFEDATGTVHINLAGLHGKTMSQHMLVTMSHELTHWLEQNSWEGYNQLRSFILDSLRNKGESIEDMLIDAINNQNKAVGAKSGKALNITNAMAEIVAKSCENLLSSKAMEEELRKVNPELHGKIRNFVKKFVARLRAAVQGMTGSLSKVAQKLYNETEEIAQLWLSARQEALSRTTEGKLAEASPDSVSFSTAEIKDMTAEELDSAYMQAVESGDMETVQWMVKEAAQRAGYTTPLLHHGTRAFGFTEFNVNGSGGMIFSTTDRRMGETYSGETKRTRITEKSTMDAFSLKGNELLKEAQKYLKRYSEYRLASQEDMERAREDARDMLRTAADEIQKFIDENKERFNEFTMKRAQSIITNIKNVSNANTEEELYDAWNKYDSDAWFFKFEDEDLLFDMLADDLSKTIYQAKSKLHDFIYDGDLYIADRYGNERVFGNQLALELDAENHKGVYELYGNPGNQLVMDANGSNWNNLVPPEELNLYGIQRTRDVANAAYAHNYDSVLIQNVRDSGGETAYNAPADVYIFFDGNQLKSADPVTYDDKGNVIPLSERFQADNADIRYSTADDAEDRQIKKQVNSHIDELMKLEPVAEVSSNVDLSKYYKNGAKSVSAAYKAWADDLMEKINHQVKRDNFGVVEISKARIRTGFSYGMNNKVKAAFAAVPDIIQKGEQINEHINHKGKRAIQSTTFAGKITMDGKPQIMAVVVTYTEDKNRYKTHKVFMPDGTVLTIEKEAAVRNAEDVKSHRLPIRAASNDNITQEENEIKYSTAEESELLDELSNARDEVNNLREQRNALKPEMDAWADKITEAQKNGNLDETLEEYKEWEKGYTKIDNALKEAQKRRDELSRKYEEYQEQRDVAEEQKKIKESGLPEEEWRRKQAVKEFGYTPYFYDAGYMLPNGKMLNFSGEKGRHFGSRGQDHRAIEGVYASSQYSRGMAMVKFMAEGNIRVMSETPGLDINSSTEPTAEQYATIRKMAREYAKEEYFNIDFTDERGNTVDSIEYDGRVNADRIVNDIKTFYRTGEAPQQSVVSQFHYSTAELDAEYDKAVSSGDTARQQELVDQAARDNGYTLKVYHGTPTGGFTQFKDWSYFTEKKEYADRYNHPSASSSRGYAVESSQPMTYALYMNPGRVFDTRNKKAAALYNKARMEYGMGELTDNGLPDWTDGRDIIDYIEENDLPYDTIILNEGADGGYGAPVVSRGVSYVTRANMVKSAEPITRDDAGNVIPLSERFNEDKNDIRWSTQESPDMEVNNFMMGLQEFNMPTNQEKTMLRQYKDLHMTIGITQMKLEDYEKKLRQLRAIENPSAYDRDQIRITEQRIKTNQNRLERLRDDIVRATKDKGYARQMMKNDSLMKNLVNGVTADQLINVVQSMMQQLNELNSEMQERAKKLQELGENATVLQIRQQFNRQGLKRIAAQLKEQMNSEVSNREIENRLALIALKMKDGKFDSETTQELVDMILGNMRGEIDTYVINELRGERIALSPAQLKELKANNSSIRELNAQIAGTGIMFTASGDTNLEHKWADLCDRITSLDRDENNLKMVDRLMTLIRGEMDSVFEARFNDANVQSTTEMVLKAAAELVPEIVTDAKSLNLIKETMQYAAQVAAQAKGTAAEVMDIDKAVERITKTGKAVSSTANTLTGDLKTAMAYFNDLSEQSEAAMWKRERLALIDQLKSENTMELLVEREKWRQKIEKDKTAREQMQTNLHMRKAIHTNVTRLRNMLINETDQKNIPEHMKGLARAMLGLIVDNDLSGRKLTGMDPKDLIETRRVLDAMLKLDGEFTTDDLRLINDEEAQAAVMDALADIEDGIGFYNNRLGKDIIVNLQALHNALEKISDGVSTIYSIISAERSISFWNRRMDIADAAEDVQRGMKNSQFKGELAGRGRKAIDATKSAVFYGNMTPVYYFKMLRNSGMDMIWEDIQEGENRNGLETAKAKAYVQQLAEKTGYRDWADEKQEVTLGGRKVTVTIDNMMELYAIWQREHTTNPEMSQHLAKGGVYIQDEAEDTGRLRREQKTQRAVRVTDDEIAEIYNKLTQAQKEYMEGIVRYLSNEMSDLGNQASMRMYGIKKYKETWYFPMKVWDGVKSARSDKGITGTDENRAAHKSWSKRRTHNAQNALVIGSFTKDAVNHIVEMINYNTMAPGIENMNKILNYQFVEGETEDELTKRNLRIMFQEAYGKEALKYLETFIKDMNGGVAQDQRKTLRDKALTMFKKNAVAGSLSVTLQQPLSYIRASMLISPKYMALAPVRQNWKDSYREMMEHSGVAVIKDMGRFDMNFGQSAKDFITPETKKNALEKISDATTIAPELADRMTWIWMWNAVKAEQAAKNPGMKTDSAQFLDMVGKRFNQVMRETQVYDSVLVKSSNMRSQNGFMKLVTSFMAEPTLSLNVLADAVGRVKAGDAKAISHMAKAAATFLLSAILQAGFKGLMGSGRTPDEKKTWLENFLNKFEYNLINEANPLSLISGYSSLIETLKTGKLQDDAMGAIGKLYSIVQTTQNAIQGNGKGWYRDIEDTAAQLAQLFTNIPAKNLMRDARAVFNMIFQGNYAKRTTSGAVIRYQREANFWNADSILGTVNTWLGEAGYKTSNKAYYSRMYNAEKSGNQAEADSIREYLTMGKGVKEDTISSNLKTLTKTDEGLTDSEKIKALRERGMEDSDIASWITKRYKEGKLTKEQATKLYLEANPAKDKNDAYFHFEQTDWEKETGIDMSESDYFRLDQALSNGNKASYDKAVKELKAHGYKEDKITDHAVSWIMKQYKEAKKNRKETENALKLYCGMKENDIYWKMDRVDYQKETKAEESVSGYYYRLTDAVKANKAEQIQKAVKQLLANGITKEQIKSKLSDWKSEYLAASGSEKIRIKDAITKAYKAAGYTAADAQKTIDNWIKDGKKKTTTKK